MIKIDSDKLVKLIRSCGLSKTEFSATLFHSDSFINKCIKRGTMSGSDVEMIKKIYDTDVEYRAPEPQIVKAEQMELGDIKLSSHRSKAYIYGILNHMENTREYVYQTSAGLNENERNTFIQLIDKALNDVEGVLV